MDLGPAGGALDDGCEGMGLEVSRGLSLSLSVRGPRGGERVRMLVLVVLVPLRAGERERVRCLSGRGGGSSGGQQSA